MKICACGHADDEHLPTTLAPCAVEGCPCPAYADDGWDAPAGETP